MPGFRASACLICWVRSSFLRGRRADVTSRSQLMFKLAIAFAIIAMTGLLGSSPLAEAASCGAKNQRPCSIFERIPSCNKGLYEDFQKGRCLSKIVPGRDCGRNNQRPCKLWERIPSCNSGLVEDFKKGRCVVKAIPGKDCGNANQRPCTIVERIPSCNDNLKEDFAKGICVALPCGKKNGRPCTIVERIPSCDKGLVEHFPSNQCTTLADLGNKFKCGKRLQKPCKLLERIPSCDSGMVEDLIKGKCFLSEEAKAYRIAEKKMKEIGGFIASKVGFATNVANNPQVVNSLSKDQTSVAQVVNLSGVGARQMPDGYLLRTMTVGVNVGAKIIIGGSGGAGAAIDLKGVLPVHAYATGDWSWNVGVAASAGIDVGFWVCQNNKIGGDSWGVEFDPADLVALRVGGATALKAGPSVAIGVWFNYDNVFQGFTITPGFGLGPDFGGYSKARTEVLDDPSVECDGSPKISSNRPRKALIAKAASSLGSKTFIQQINYGGGFIQQQKVVNKATRPDLVRICLENYTDQPKAITHAVPGINPLTASTNGSRSCANFNAKLRLPLKFIDRGIVKKQDVMSLKYFAGDIVVFEWIRDY